MRFSRNAMSLLANRDVSRSTRDQRQRHSTQIRFLRRYRVNLPFLQSSRRFNLCSFRSAMERNRQLLTRRPATTGLLHPPLTRHPSVVTATHQTRESNRFFHGSIYRRPILAHRHQLRASFVDDERRYLMEVETPTII